MGLRGTGSRLGSALKFEVEDKLELDSRKLLVP